MARLAACADGVVSGQRAERTQSSSPL
jgi:hypothetical protein